MVVNGHSQVTYTGQTAGGDVTVIMHDTTTDDHQTIMRDHHKPLTCANEDHKYKPLTCGFFKRS